MSANKHSATHDIGHGHLRRYAIWAALAASVASITPAAADPFGSMLKSVVPGVPSSPSKPKSDQANTANTTGAPGSMNMNEGTPVAPLHGLGTDAVAMVEDAKNATGVEAMDYVFAKQTIDLGKKGEITLGFLAGCRTEVIKDGTVTVALAGSTVAGGTLTVKETPGCKAPTPIVLAAASESGATVNRITPFSAANWNERTLKSPAPIFKWDKALGAVTLRVKDMDKDGEPVIWEAHADKDWINYPASGEKLATGQPYKVEAVVGDRVAASALFSIDTTLDVAENMANRLVPLSAP